MEHATAPYAPIFEVTRGKTTESIHFGSIAVVDSHANLVAWSGDPDAVTFLRSSAKPFQALPFIESGGAQHFGLTPKEIALICSSHSGTDEHVATVKGIQAKTGVSESDLMCGVHRPYHMPTAEAMRQRGEEPTPNRHNCSGKHTGMLAYTLMKQLPLKPSAGQPAYIDPTHPIQQDILKAFAEMCGLSPDQISIGIDGCSVPTFAVPLRNAALAFARLCDPVDLPPQRVEACRTITAAMTGNPNMVGGPDSFDTRLMVAAHGRVVCKGGAEGFQALGIMPGALGAGSPGMGVAFKVSDGDLGAHSRALGDPYGHVRPAVALEILRQLGVLNQDDIKPLAEYGPRFTVTNWRKIEVGEARPIFELQHSTKD